MQSKASDGIGTSFYRGIYMIWAAIRCAMERADIKSISELARLSGIKAPTLTQTRRRKPETFILYEIRQLDKVLDFTPAEWRMIERE